MTYLLKKPNQKNEQTNKTLNLVTLWGSIIANKIHFDAISQNKTFKLFAIRLINKTHRYFYILQVNSPLPSNDPSEDIVKLVTN